MKKKYLIKYSFEFVVIVIGISVSFWLNEISIGNQNEEERIKVLNSLSIEAAEIKKYCDERVERWYRDREILRMFLNTDGQKLYDAITDNGGGQEDAMSDNKAIVPLDVSKIKNWKNLIPEYKEGNVAANTIRNRKGYIFSY